MIKDIKDIKAFGRGVAAALRVAGPMDGEDENLGLTEARAVLDEGGHDLDWATLLAVAEMPTSAEEYRSQIFPRDITNDEHRMLTMVNMLREPSWTNLVKFLEI